MSANGKHWISNRCQKTGGSINPNPSKQRKGPLRKILCVVRSGSGLFDRHLVMLECGHAVHSDGIYKARCHKCAAGLPPEGVDGN